MKSCFLTLCLAAAIGINLPVNARGDDSGQESQRLRVLTYNIHHGEGTDGRLDLKRIANTILSVDPDVVALQEVDQNVARSMNVDQPGELARLTGMHAVFGDNIALACGRYGNAVLSRFPIVRYQNNALPNVDQGEQRGCLSVEIRLPHSDGTLMFLATHLDHRRPDRERVASARAINTLGSGLGDEKQLAVLAGDLNDVPESSTLTEFSRRWTRANKDPLLTIPVVDPKRQIDYVMFHPAARFRVLETRVLEESVASDHRGLLVILEIRQP